MTRAEHIAWCKQRALFELEQPTAGNVANALASLLSDLQKHDETRDHPALLLAGGLMLLGQLNSAEEVRKFIEGTN